MTPVELLFLYNQIDQLLKNEKVSKDQKLKIAQEALKSLPSRMRTRSSKETLKYIRELIEKDIESLNKPQEVKEKSPDEATKNTSSSTKYPINKNKGGKGSK